MEEEERRQREEAARRQREEEERRQREEEERLRVMAEIARQAEEALQQEREAEERRQRELAQPLAKVFFPEIFGEKERPIQATCPQCGASYTLTQRQAGKKVRCRKCSSAFTVEAKPQRRERGQGKQPRQGPIIVTCPECGRKLRCLQDIAGKEVRCPGCGNNFVVLEGDDS